jgi:hypothetical protein
MKCSRCNREVPDEEIFAGPHGNLCEDCYLKARQTVQACDPLATRLALRIREKLGTQGADNLTAVQKAIYDFVKSRGKATAQEITGHLALSSDDLDTQLAVLRHCELVKGHKEGNTVYLVPFTSK